MQEVHPVDRLSEAIMALEGICDLLCQLDSKDMYLVNPYRFYFTVSMPVKQAREAYEELISGR